MNEAETRAEHIDPAIKAAGWGSVDGSRVQREFPIAPGQIQGRGRRATPKIADYCLVYKNTKLAVIEAKAWGKPLTEGVGQAKEYAAKMAAGPDRRAFEQILANLLENALRHSPPGGRVDVSARGAGDRVVIEVADEGPGIVKHTSTYKRPSTSGVGATPNPYLSTTADRHVDPHGSLEESWFGLRVDVTPGVWERSRQVTLVGQPAYAMASEDLLLHLGVHLVFHLLMGKPSLVQIYDIALICQTTPMDWEALLARSVARNAASLLYAALHLAALVFGAPVPAQAADRLRRRCPDSLAATIDGWTLADVMQQTQKPPLITVRQRLARGVAERRETARWTTTWQGKWAVWRTAVDVGRTDTGKLIGQRFRWRLGG